MAKIAALILPSSRAPELESLCSAMQEMLCLHPPQRTQTAIYHGKRAACALLRVTPDPLNPTTQPTQSPASALVACGYYFSSVPIPDTDSASRLAMDLATCAGPAALARGDGVYGYARWDKQRECLVAGVDKVGMRPLFWTALPGGGYAIASEPKALIPLQNELDIDWSAWEERLTFGNVFGNHTFLRNIQRFGPAQAITFRRDGYTSRTVERFLENIEIRDRPLAEFLEEQGARFDAAMARLATLYDAAGNTMLTLSGGYDSRRVLGWLLNQNIRPTVYTVPEVLSDGREYESAIVRDLCRIGGLDGYSVFPVNSNDRTQLRVSGDLMADFGSHEHAFSATLVMGLGYSDRVNFDGLAAGSQLSGSFMTPAYFEPDGDAAFVNKWPKPARQWLHFPHSGSAPLRERIRTALDQWQGHPNRFAYFYLMGRTRRMTSLHSLAIQANAFESLCPYLDRDMMRSALSFPPERKVDAHLQMPLIRTLSRALGGVRTADQVGGDSCPINGMEQRSERRALLKSVARLGTTGQKWSVSNAQRWRFRLASFPSIFKSNRRLHWNFTTAVGPAQLAFFEEISRTPADYSRAVADLKSRYKHHTEWCRPL